MKVREPVLAEGACAVATLCHAPEAAAPVTLVGCPLDQGDNFGSIDIDASMLGIVREADVEAEDEQVLFRSPLCVPVFASKFSPKVISAETSWTTYWICCPSFCPGRFRTLPDGRLFVRPKCFARVFQCF